MLAFFGFGGGEMLLILALVLILRKSVGGLTKELDQEAHDAGESIGGIYGKPATQALTPDNRIAELYDPAVFRNPRPTQRMGFRGWFRWWQAIRGVISRMLIAMCRGRK